MNSERVRPDQVPGIFADREIIRPPEMVDTGYVGDFPRASARQGMNFIMINPDLAVVSDVQRNLISELKKRGVTVAPLRMRHARTLSGGFHRATVDVQRAGELADHR